MSSGRRRRVNWRATLERCFALDVRRMQRCGYLRSGQISEIARNLNGESGDNLYSRAQDGGILLLFSARSPSEYDWVDHPLDVDLSWTSPPFGGRRPWWLCPICRRRCAILYSRVDDFVCRACTDLPYTSQCEDAYSRAIRRAHRKWSRLDRFGDRPKGMHQTTYERLLRDALEAEKVADTMLDHYLKRFS